jgi:hypothetical protein
MKDVYVVDGYDSGTQGLTRVFSSKVPPRMPSNDCGCVRTRDEHGWSVAICDKHRYEPGIVYYMLD